MLEKKLKKAKELMDSLSAMPEVCGCTLYGSLARGGGDALSDIDIEIDVSGSDNGIFMLGLAGRLAQTMPVYYADYAPSFVPEKYIVSVALDENDPFLVADLCCSAVPHCETVTRSQVKVLNAPVAHTVKLWTANLKHFARGGDCRGDILRMAQKIGISGAQEKGSALLLEETLCWLESNVTPELTTFVDSCRIAFEALVPPHDGTDK